MSKSDIKKVIVLGSGALKIGQAGEYTNKINHACHYSIITSLIYLS